MLLDSQTVTPSLCVVRTKDVSVIFRLEHIIDPPATLHYVEKLLGEDHAAVPWYLITLLTTLISKISYNHILDISTSLNCPVKTMQV